MIPGIVAGSRQTSGGGGGSDPFFANVSLLLHFEGTDGSTVFTDSSGSPKALTARDNAQIDTAQFKFGAASGLFDGSGDAVTAADNAGWDFGSGAFTVECFVRFNALPSSGNAQVILSQWSNTTAQAAWFLGLVNNAGTYQLNFAYTTNGTTQVNSARNVTVATGVWYHIAVSRSGNTMRYFVDGVQAGADINVTGVTIFNSTSLLTVGAQTNNPATPTFNFSVNGHLDELRITKGIARYTADFTPPTAQFPDS